MSNGPIAWMAKNRVTSNLLLIFLVFGGLFFLFQLKQEVFPEFDLDIIQVVVPYPGASPEEVEQGIILSVEDQVRGLEGVKTVRSSSFEGKGTVTVELLSNANKNKTLQDVKNRIDQIESFPDDSDRPIVTLVENRQEVISIVIFGEVPKWVLRDLAEKIRNDLIQEGDVTLVELSSVPPVEISVEIPRADLRRYNLTLESIAETIRDTALELPGGGIKTPSGEILLRTKERRDFASEFENIPIISDKDGTEILLSDIATLKDGFEETDQEAFFNGIPAIKIDVFRVGEQKPLVISNTIHEYVKELRSKLPEEIGIETWNDRAELYRDRINLLLRNAGLGLFLVLILLGLFLEPRLAFWVTVGIPISIIGAFLFVSATTVSINMVSLFAFILTLGIIVDDAIVVGENIYKKRENGLPFLKASIEGAKEISIPVVFAVLTNIAAFIPLFLVPGSIGKIFIQIPTIVIAVLCVSLIESLFVLPSHLSYEHAESKFWTLLAKPSIYIDAKLDRFIQKRYKQHLFIALKYRYITISCGIGILIFTVGLFLGGVIQFSFLPRVDNDLVSAQATLTVGVPLKRSREVQKQIVKAAEEVIKENNSGDISRGIYTQIGTSIVDRGPASGEGDQEIGSHFVGVQVMLVSSNYREISGEEFAKEWRNKVGDIAGIDSLIFVSNIGTGTGEAIDIQLSHPNIQINELAALELATILERYQGVNQIDDGVTTGKRQMNFTLKPEARSLGVTVEDLARQVRSAFYGAEALKQQRGRNEVEVRVRLPKEERSTPYTVEELMIRTDKGGEIPLIEAADIQMGRAYTEIKRQDGRRIVSVTADVDANVANTNEILHNVQKKVLPHLLEKYPGLSYKIEGEEKERNEAIQALGYGFIFAIIVIYSLLAIPFKSYFQPFIVMISIPFGIIGAVIGHILLGYEISIISMMGIIALSGVVVNDSLVLIVTANQNYKKERMSALDSIISSGAYRFRPILLTSLTTFFGLAPMIFETTVQARFLIPMAVSLGFGVLFATFITLILVPCFYLVLHDLGLLHKE